jgi:glutamate racemase
VSDAPIGVFDSGIGGLSVYGEVRRRLPTEDVLYLADQGFGMYGEKSLGEVRRRSEQVADFLIDEGAKAVVVACNSASAAALDHLRKRWPAVPFIGMEPAVKPAVELSRHGVIGVLATEATFQGELFASVVNRFARNHEVITRACPGLAAAIESDDPVVDDLVDEYVGDVVRRGADVVVLGCTHYSLIVARIAERAGAASVVDPAPAVARQVARIVTDHGLGAAAGEGAVTFVTTGDKDRFSEQISRWGYGSVGAGSVAV